MNKYATRAELKAKARASLIGHYLPVIGAFLAFSFLQYFITVPSTFLDITPPFGIVFYYASCLFLELFFCVFQMGFACLFLCNACQRPIGAGFLFTGFWNRPGRTIAVRFFPTLLLLLLNLIPTVLLRQYLAVREEKWLMYAIFFFLVFLPVSWFIRILYSQTYYVMLDFPELGARECLRRSRRLMKGNMLRYLWLDLSFLPLLLLGLFSCGIGLLYVRPYQEQTCAYFYLDLISKRQS